MILNKMVFIKMKKVLKSPVLKCLGAACAGVALGYFVFSDYENESDYKDLHMVKRSVKKLDNTIENIISLQRGKKQNQKRNEHENVDLTIGTHLVLLGTGTPVPDPYRSGPSVAIVVNGTSYIIDCGPGVVRRATAAGLNEKKMEHLFITHLHSDHTIGYPDMLLTPWVVGRDKLLVFGPHGIKKMHSHVVYAFSEDIEVRVGGYEKKEPQEVTVTEIDNEGIIFTDENVTVTAFYVKHGSWKESLGYMFETNDGKKIVISGDTTPCENIIKYAKDCDILVHEIYSKDGYEEQFGNKTDVDSYHQSFHTSTTELSEIAQKTCPKLLVLYHQLFFGNSTTDSMVKEIKKDYDGYVISGDDLDKFTL